MAFRLETIFNVSVSVTKACAHCRCVSKNIPSLHVHPHKFIPPLLTMREVVNRKLSRWCVTLL